MAELLAEDPVPGTVTDSLQSLAPSQRRSRAWHRNEGTLFVSGCVPNQGRFYDRFDAVVLLSAPADVMLARIEARTNNPFGKSPEERKRILADLSEIEPLLRAGCTHELDASRPLADVVADLVAIAGA